MSIYLKVFKFLKPFLKFIVLSMILTFLYVMLNNLSLWISVDFIGELFPQSELVPAEKSDTLPTGFGTDTLKTVQSDPKIKKNVPDSVAVSHSSKKPIDVRVGSSVSYKNLYKSMKKTVKRALIRKNKYDTLLTVCVVILITFLLKNIFDYFRRLINDFIQLKVVVDLRNKLQQTIIRLPLSYFDNRHTGTLTSIVYNDVKAIRNVLDSSFGKIVLIPIQILTNVVILLLISWKLSLVTFVIIPISGVTIVQIGKSLRRKSRRVFKQISVTLSIFQEAVSSIRIVKAFTSENREIQKFRDANRKFFLTQFRAHRLSQVTSPLNEISAVMILIALLWYGGNLVYAQELVAEDFIRFLIFLFASLDPLRQLSGLNNVIQRGMAAAERIFSVLDTRQEVYDNPDAEVLNSFREQIVLDHVEFQYNSNESVVLKDINLDIKKGQTVAFVGHSGSGKTTLVSLIPRFYDVTNGEIRIDGTDIRKYALTSLRNQIGIVTQETFLFNDTVRNNIAYGLDDAEVNEDQIVEAARIANAYEFIENMEKGFQTVIGERGLKLSGGQKQRLSIARAVLKNPPILILDEATSALDTESERLVQEAIEKIMKNRTVLVIAHRLSTVIHADKIVVMNRSEIVDIGKHQQLLESCPLYNRLYEMQFRDESNNDKNETESAP